MIYEKDTKEKIANEINLVSITSIDINVHLFVFSHVQEAEKGVYPFVLHEGENEIVLGCEDEFSRR